MKTRLYIKLASAALIAMTGFSSCLKDDAHYVDFAGTTPLIELPSAANVGGKGGLFQTTALDNAESVPVQLAVNLASPHTLSSDLTIKVSVDAAALTSYNSTHGNKYIILPTSFYTSTFTTKIPANTNLAYITINVKSSLIDPGITNYVLPLTITDGGGQQISNYKTVLLNLKAKNIYDGAYTSTGSITFPAPQAGRNFSNLSKNVSTIDGTTSLVDAADLGGSGYSMYLTVNPATNAVTVTPSPDSANQTLQNDGSCTYDPATKTFTLNYKYVGGTGDRKIHEVIKHN
jgi:hypothetical protein